MVGLGMSSPSVVAEAQADEHRHARSGQKIVLTAADGRQAQATLLDNATARTFAAKLPLKVRMGDHFGRELYGAMPAIAVSDPLQKNLPGWRHRLLAARAGLRHLLHRGRPGHPRRRPGAVGFDRHEPRHLQPRLDRSDD